MILKMIQSQSCITFKNKIIMAVNYKIKVVFIRLRYLSVNFKIWLCFDTARLIKIINYITVVTTF
jgi:hypothetical protein